MPKSECFQVDLMILVLDSFVAANRLVEIVAKTMVFERSARRYTANDWHLSTNVATKRYFAFDCLALIQLALIHEWVVQRMSHD